MSEETRKEREDRLAAEYAAYVAQCKTDGCEHIDYMQWQFSQKMREQGKR